MKRNWQQFLTWCVITALGIFLLSILVPNLPSEMKKLFLVPLFFCCSSVAIAKWLASQMEIPISISMMGVCFLFLISGQVFSGIESHRQWQAPQLVQIEKMEIDNLAITNLPSPSGSSVETTSQTPFQKIETQNTIKELRLQAVRFPGYLNFRYSPLGMWNSPIPEIIWGVEILISSLFGMLVWIFPRSEKYGDHSSDHSEKQSRSAVEVEVNTGNEK